MLLKDNLPQYKEEIAELYKTYLGEKVTGGTFFGVIEDGELQAISSVRCYHSHWFLRGCVVKPEFRGEGLQRKLIQERLDYLAKKTGVVKVSVYPWNINSIDNVLAEGFTYEKKKKLSEKAVLHVYKKVLD